MPKPHDNETKSEFISRCISYMEENEKDKFPTKEQRIAVCYSYWDKHDKEKNDRPKSLMSRLLNMLKLK